MPVPVRISRPSLAHFFEPWEIPSVWKIPALLRLDGLNRAIAVLEEDALAVWFFNQGQPPAIGPQSGVGLDKCKLVQALETGHARDLVRADLHLPGPPATGGAALAFQDNRHAKCYTTRGKGFKAQTFGRPKNKGLSIFRFWLNIGFLAVRREL